MAAVPTRNDRRVILHLDYDCFYASVFEVEQPALKSLPLAVQQKQIVVTCNYEARRRGLHKLQLIKDAKRICPDVVIVLGEDLTKFRDASKDLYSFMRGFIWGGRVERLGFDELSLDVTEMVDYNVQLLNSNDLATSFFHLDRKDPTVGFVYDSTRFLGATYPPMQDGTVVPPEISSLDMRLLLGSHLIGYLRSRMEHEKGFTATGGVSTSKLLAKLVGAVHKPNNQTTLLSPYETPNDSNTQDSNVTKFMDAHEIRKIPGIGSRLAQKLRLKVTGQTTGDEKLTVRDVRLFPGMDSPTLEKTLGGPGAPKGIGMKVWSILHGVDNTDVLEARDLPTQISIEDTYGRGRLDTIENVRRELEVLARSLIRRMRADLLDKTDSTAPQPRWLAHPRTLRLSTRPRNPPETDGARSYNWNRISRSAPLPSFVFHVDESIDAIAERLVHEHAMTMFRKLHPEKSGWDLQLMNIAVTNLVESAGEQKQSSGRDIGKMFRQQEAVLRDWRIHEPEPGNSEPDDRDHHTNENQGQDPLREQEMQQPGGCAVVSDREDGEWQEDDESEGLWRGSLANVECSICGAAIPHFALLAHETFHAVENEAV
ncbi:DNA polymerase iota [Penicillium brasilianum]|uniref:DNA polymerase iota n=1 Tax=Penicillium brasilianum TaxID=104259 RepID=A0A1S9RYM8_PENBI|nr:DNA polymerase iota [Penicillium brasilianum]